MLYINYLLNYNKISKTMLTKYLLLFFITLKLIKLLND